MRMRSTTIVAVRKGGQVALAGDGQVTLGEHAVKHTGRKVLRLVDGKVLAGFAGGAADALSLLDRVENQVREAHGDLERAVMQFAKEWRTDRMLRRLEAMLVVANERHTFVLSGNGDVLRPDEDVVAIGSGGAMAHAAALALHRHTDLSPEAIAREAIGIAGTLCIYTNEHVTVEVL
ncbi:MAG TPA: ATP-dependent protease subunit HslV [Armatimonadota bacterium]|nr:ATP-dependent protease subunit HslV [Armatimonadota bacterium]